MSIFKDDPDGYIDGSMTEYTRLPLKCRWQWMELEDKNNFGRRTLRRYVALIANKGLRADVFGF